MAKYKNREVTATRLTDDSEDQFIIYSEDYKGEKVKRSELTFTPEEKDALLKQDAEDYKTNPDTYKVEEVKVVEPVKVQPKTEPAVKSTATRIVPEDSKTVKNLQNKTESKATGWPFKKG